MPSISMRRSPVAWMLAAVVCYAPLPLLVWQGVQHMSPLMFTALWYTANGVLHLSAAQGAAWLRGDRGCGVAMLADLRASKSSYLAAVTLCKAEWVLFAAAVTLVDPSVVTVIFEAWPVFFAAAALTGFWRRRLHSGSVAAGGGTPETLLMLFVGAAGVALVVLSEHGLQGPAWTARAVLGLSLAAAAAVLSAAADVTLQAMGADPQPDRPKRPPTNISASGNAASQMLTAPVFALVAIATAGVPSFAAASVVSAAAAGAAQLAGNWCFQHSLHLARRSQGTRAARINTLYYFTPVAALGLLAVSGATRIARPDLLIAGAAGVVAVNMVLHLDPEGVSTRQGRGGFGYRAAVIALWASAVLVLFRDDWLPRSWEVWSVTEYWGMVAVLATVFVLIYSFRQSRVSEMRRAADDLTLGLHHRLGLMATFGPLSPNDAGEAMSLLRTVDSAVRADRLADAYLRLRRLLASAVTEADEQHDAEAVAEALADVERLVAVRQQGRGFAEPATLAMVAAVTAAVTAVARPSGDIVPFAGWVHDTVSMTVTAAFMFLGFDLHDKRREADAPMLTPQSHTGNGVEWRLDLDHGSGRRAQRIIAAALGAVLLIGAVTMLAAKWL